MRDRRVTWGLAALCAAAAVYAAACGSSSSDNSVPPDQDGGAGDGSVGTDGGGTNNADGSSNADSGGTTNDAAANNDAAPVVRDGGIFTDAAPSVTGDGGAADDAGPGGSTSQISCGTTSCALATDFCCVYNNKNAPPDFLFTCASGSACPNLSGGNDPTALGCSSAANCPASTVCCIRDDGNRIWSECSATCTDTGSISAAQLCDPTLAPAQTGCPTTDPCSNNSIGDWKLPDGFATCGGRGN